MFKITLVKNDGLKSYDLTPVVNGISWDSNLSIASVMDFTTFWGRSPYPNNPVELGDLVVVTKDGVEVDRGIVVKSKQNDSITISYTAFDYGWYLGKSKSVYQFNKIPAKQAITKILTDFGMPIGSITSMDNLIDSVFVQKTPAEIITTIIKAYERQTGVKVFSELREGRIYIEKMSDAVIIGKFSLASGMGDIDVLGATLGADRTRSIEELRNRIKIITASQDDYQTLALAEDTVSEGKYGLLEDTYKIDEADAAKARQVAKILLQRLNKVHETNKIRLMGDIAFKAGRLFDVVEPETGMQGRYMITQAKHNVDAGGVHTMELTLTLPEDIA
ncbi:XkdQ/YqbQ family protein [Desulfosporosinus nitroreducens]|uniref:XkdQ/YqbQ family protein n=1 Tax=Desulfosporosinus nitroreducens TaxID=2018668 RepID=UPI00207D6930|nr:hypothetical protein [Desulfosporosinus nitroreducens]MCO1599821.1 hypothetical protein [Desulfosporosinus nitroreducens]